MQIAYLGSLFIEFYYSFAEFYNQIVEFSYAFVDSFILLLNTVSNKTGSIGSLFEFSKPCAEFYYEFIVCYNSFAESTRQFS
jgi:hypothetical protein